MGQEPGACIWAALVTTVGPCATLWALSLSLVLKLKSSALPSHFSSAVMRGSVGGKRVLGQLKC